ncbi:MAG: antibiotic biosynthesis monooxygenase family protein [Polyangiaceae bacterium]
MATIRKGTVPVTLINTFTVRPENADRLVELLVEATDSVMRHRPGFVSANIHVSADRRHVANYAQWRSKEDFEAMRGDRKAGEHMAEAGKLAEHFEPILYEVVHVEDRAAG